MASDHDKRYKKLFSHPVIVKELLLYFINEDFIKNIDFSSLERMDKSFITDNFKEKEADIIYKVTFKDNEAYIYLLMEFQSTVDKYMAIRINRYLAEFYEFLAYTVNGKEIPATFPIMLYNGEEKWTASTQIQDLIQSTIPDKYIPHFSYYKIIENEIPKEVLLRIENAVSAIFYVENSKPEELKNEFQNIIRLLEKEQPDLILLFKRWLNNLFQTSKDNWETEEFNEQIENLMEVKIMFETALKERDKKMIEQGIELERLELAKRMKDEDVDIALISKITGLSIDEIAEL
ncbi:MAG: Rpn family recombination-promoting nuclease/putative transposase [Spirochaetales bacterium]|nr:Rpn family recombination-promoting nuclease/putative transposase [Spirochaetales bacterium]